MIIAPDKQVLPLIYKLPPYIIKEMRDNLAFFIKVAFNEDLWSKQLEVVEALEKYKRVSVRSCFSVGKSFLASRIAVAFSQTHPNSIVAITAPTFNQVKNIIFREIHSAYSKARIELLGKPKTIEWNITQGKWYMSGFSTDAPDRAQGKHTDSVLAIIDESSGVEDNIFEAMESWGASGNFYELMIGNPLRAFGSFYDSFYNPSFYNVGISAFDTPNFTGEKVSNALSKNLMNESFVKMIVDKYGEDSSYYKIAVLGEFPMDTDNSLFKVDDIEYALYRKDTEIDVDDVVITADVAYTGSDATVIVIWKGLTMVAIKKIVKNDTVEVVGWIKKFYKDYKAKRIIIDATGFGAGVYDSLKDESYDVTGVKFGESAIEDDKYANIRAEMYFNLFFSLREHKVKLIGADDIKKELLVQAYTLDKFGRFLFVKKSTLRAKLSGHSPDLADAVALRFVKTDNLLGIA